MALLKEEVKTYFGQCKCCLDYAYLKNMWEEYLIEGNREIYGKMLIDCFSITWTIQDKVEGDRICQNCIMALRDAANFKNQVLKSQEYLLQEGEATDHASIKITSENIDSFNDSDGDGLITYRNVASDEDQEPSKHEASEDQKNRNYEQETQNESSNEEVVKMEQSDDDQKLFENIEFLEEDVFEDADSLDSQLVVKRPPYRQYSEEDLEAATEAVVNRRLTAMQASVTFNIPRRTILKTAKDYKKKPGARDHDSMYKFIKGLKSILAHTNATLFRRKVNGYICFFCPRTSSPFETPQELRLHTRTDHPNKLTQVCFAMRPYHKNQTVRIDLKDFSCNNCDTKGDWEDLLDHIEMEHGVELEETRNRLVPFRLEENEMSCVLCDFAGSFLNMDMHMNSHFKNFICGDCGESFLTGSRLLRHSKTHDIGAFPCNVCDKVFTREIYRRKHNDIVHKKRSIFKCIHCNERFPTAGLRSDHMREQHMEKLQSTFKHCPHCDKTLLPGAYNQHMRLHTDTYVCGECNKSFLTEKLLEVHKAKHAGVKNFRCDYCFKPYFSKQAVYMHVKYKHK